MITAGGYTTETAISAIEAKLADAVAFGRMFIANPDLPQRIRAGVPLNALPFDGLWLFMFSSFWLHWRKPQGHFFATIAGYRRFSHDNHFRSRG
jgi:hypothetical protein